MLNVPTAVWQTTVNQIESVLAALTGSGELYANMVVELRRLDDKRLWEIYLEQKRIKETNEDNDIAGEDAGVRHYVACLPAAQKLQYDISVMLTRECGKILRERGYDTKYG